LYTTGLTNDAVGDWGIMASATPSKMVFALCCGHVVKDTNKDECPSCMRALKWRSDTIFNAEREIEKYLEKCSGVKKNSNKEIDYKARHQQRVAAANKERVAISKMKEGIGGETKAG
jgi:hypothetical protein